MSAATELQALLRFLSQDAKVPLATVGNLRSPPSFDTKEADEGRR
jgi:hypothetical protein